MPKKYEINDFLQIKSSSTASFNLDGSKISYLSNLSGTHQLYIISSQGGEAEQVTSYDDSLAFALFSPTQDMILFGKSEGGDEKIQFFTYMLETKEIKRLTMGSSVKNTFGKFAPDGKHFAYSHNARNGVDFDVCLMNIETGESEIMYDGGGSCHTESFSPDGKHMVLLKRNTNQDTDLYLFSLKDKSAELITKRDEAVVFEGAHWLADSSGFFTRTNKERDFLGLSKFMLNSRTFEYVFTPEWDVDSARISFDKKMLAISVNEDGYNKLGIYSVDTLEQIPLTGLTEHASIYSAKFSKDSRFLALTMGDSRHVADIWLYSLEEHTCKQLTSSPQGVPPEIMVEPTLIRYTSFDGLQIPAFVYLPSGAPVDQKLPVIINIHGGPEAQYTPSLVPLTQYFVYQGYAVIAPNVRGSAGYGKKYLALDDIEKRLDSVKDLAAIHEYIQTVPELDSNKVALMGRSYGGYMVLAGLAFYPNLWVGGVDIVGISNFITFLENTAPYRRSFREAEYGYLDKHRELLYAISPINHIEHIKAPLMVIHGANDPRVPLNEAEQITEKLTGLGRRVELLVYYDEGHGLSKLKNRLDAYPKVSKFFKEIFSV